MKGLRFMVRPVRWRIAVAVFIGLVRVTMSLVFVKLSRILVDIACGQSSQPLWTFVALFAGVMLVQLLSNVAFNYWEGLIDVKTRQDLRTKLFSSVMRSSWNSGKPFHSADAVNRMQEDLRVVTELICSRIPDSIVTFFQLVAASVYLIILAPGLAWVLIVLMVFAVVGSRLFFSRIRRLTDRIRAKDSEIQGHMQENIQHRALVLTLFGPGRVISALDTLQDEYQLDVRKRLGYNAAGRGFIGFGFMGGYVAAFLWGVLGISRSTVTFGMMTEFLQLVGQVQRPIMDLSRHVPAFVNALTSVERLMELLELPGEPQGDDVLMEGAPGIRLSKLSFTYPDGGAPVLKGMDFDFVPGSTTLISGPTGAGKSTLVKLILGLLEPSQGSIEIYDAAGARQVSALTRCNFQYVPQGNSLMSGTIRDNLLLADPDATPAQMESALRLAAADFVMDLPAGLDTPCRESGAGLSEGQAQRIAIARALLKKGGVLILDEASSALDPSTEQTLLDNLASGCKGKKTILFISHREAVSRYADASLEI